MKVHAVLLHVSAAFAVSQSCTLCPNGAESNRTLVIPFSDGKTNCGHLEKLALRAKDDAAACQEIQSNAAWCQCPGVKSECTLCHGGIAPPDASIVVEEANGATCGELAYRAILAPNQGECQQVTAHAKACNCPSINERSLVCSSICPDGSELSIQQREALVGKTTSGTVLTCGEFQDSLANGVIHQDRCSTYTHIGVYACGCKALSLPKPACQLCDSNKVPANLLYDVDGKGSTCVEFMSALATVVEPDSCRAFQATAGVYCQCVDPARSGSACRICGGDTLLPDPTLVANPSRGISCSELEYVANLNGGEYCSSLQTNYKEVCCEPVQEDVYGTDQLPYSDDTYIGATAPPFVRPVDESELLEDSGAKGTCLTISTMTILVIAVSSLRS